MDRRTVSALSLNCRKSAEMRVEYECFMGYDDEYGNFGSDCFVFADCAFGSVESKEPRDSDDPFSCGGGGIYYICPVFGADMPLFRFKQGIAPLGICQWAYLGLCAVWGAGSGGV